MKKLFLILLLVCGFSIYTFADADSTHILAAGVGIPFGKTTVKWDETFMESDVFSLSGVNFDLQYRYIRNNSMAVSLDFDLGSAKVKINDYSFNGGDFQAVIGVGKCFMPINDFRIVLSGITGFDFIYGKNNASVKITEFNFLVGGDLYLNKNFTKNFGIFAQCSALVGIGGAGLEQTYRIMGIEVNSVYSGSSEMFVIEPKFGLSWTF